MQVIWQRRLRLLHMSFTIFLLILVCILLTMTMRPLPQKPTVLTAHSPKASRLVPLILISFSEFTSHRPRPRLSLKEVNHETQNTNHRLEYSMSTNKVQVNITQGVPAMHLHEAGHLNASSNICTALGKKVKLLTMITSAVANDKSREAIRNTWGSFVSRRDIAIAFILGSTLNETLNKKLDEEQALHADVIRGQFIDAYDNLTLKTILILEWVDKYCPKAAFVLKTDDDMFINIARLLNLIAKLKASDKTIYGRVAKKWQPVRMKKSKYYVSQHQYKYSVFPDFTTGPAYLFPSLLAKPLYLGALGPSLNHSYVKLEDVYITGIIANELNITRVHVREFFNDFVSLTPCNAQRAISIHNISPWEQYDLWKKLYDQCNT